MAETSATAAKPAGLAEELKQMDQQYVPLLPIEKKLVGYTFLTGVVLLVILVVISRMI